MRVDTLAVLVPETTTDLNYFLEPCEHEVRFTGEFRDMQSITVAHAMH
jgi:hypothetical protein